MATVSKDETKEPLVKTKTSNSGRVRIILLNRPRSYNAISTNLAKALFDELQRTDNDDKIRAIVISGAGRAFCAGADVLELSKQTTMTAEQNEFLADWGQTMRRIRTPIIAAVNGFALGGGMELALMADIVHCGKSAYFGLPEVRLGTIPGAGGTQRLTALVGKSRASEIILSAENIYSDEALQRGIVSRIHPDDSLLDDTVAFAERIAKHSLHTLKLAKQAINASQHSVEEGIDIERRLYYMSFDTPAFREGVSAFLKKRDPNFNDC